MHQNCAESEHLLIGEWRRLGGLGQGDFNTEFTEDTERRSRGSGPEVGPNYQRIG